MLATRPWVRPAGAGISFHPSSPDLLELLTLIPDTVRTDNLTAAGAVCRSAAGWSLSRSVDTRVELLSSAADGTRAGRLTGSLTGAADSGGGNRPAGSGFITFFTDGASQLKPLAEWNFRARQSIVSRRTATSVPS
ncbi:hypothetical protein GCM10027535_16630 [Mycolicibacterium hippocampi]